MDILLKIKNCLYYGNYQYSSNPSSYKRGIISCGGIDLLIENCTITFNYERVGDESDCMVAIIGGNPTIRNTIIAFSQWSSTAFRAFPGASVYPNFTIENTNLYLNFGGDWTDEIAHLAHINGNISEDHLFCDPLTRDYHINEMSFCNPAHPLNSNGIQIGALGVNCSGCDDTDNDGICDDNDNCLTTYNPDQTDTDFDGIGNDCDDCPNDSTNDADNDGVCDDIDNCLALYNPSQTDLDSDSLGNECNNCPESYNPLQSDTDLDGLGDACCCKGIRGNINGSSDEQINISDLVAMVAYMFISDIPFCPNEIDVNGDGTINISDLVYLIFYMFQDGPAPVNCP